MDKKYLYFLNIIKNMMFAVNVVIILFYVSVVLLTTKYVVDNGLSRNFLDSMIYVPHDPLLIFWGILCSLSILFCTMYYWKIRRIKNRKIGYICGVVELIVCILIIYLLYMSYNGIVLLVFCDCVYYLKLNRYYNIVLIFLAVIYLLANYDVFTYFYPMANMEQFFLVYDVGIRSLLMMVRTGLINLNILLFIIFMVIYIMKQLQEKEKIIKKLSIVEYINKKMQKYIDISEKIVEKNERKRLARELHDTMGHALAGMAVGVDACVAIIDKNPQMAKKQLKIISDTIRKSMVDVRNSLNKMRPNVLQENSFKEALEKMIEEFFVVTKMRVNLDYQLGDIDIGSQREDVLFRVIQESITNSIRHGLSTKVDIKIYKDNNIIYIWIKDNGIGCKFIKYGFGLKQMIERVEMINGKIEFKNEQGFLTEVKIPM